MPQPDHFIGNAVATVVVTAGEGALDREQFDAALAGELPSVDRLDPLKSRLTAPSRRLLATR